VAIAGLGGVGGAHLETLARLGVGAFSIADPDTFELSNLNRQAGAAMSTLGQAKVEVMEARARDIAPGVDISSRVAAIDASNVDAFLDGADLYVDGLDVFAMEARRLVFARCEVRGIPAVTAGPIGMGASVMTFLPGGMGFEEYFRLEGCDLDEQVVRFLVGLAPAALQRPSLVVPDALCLRERRVPSTPMGMAIAAGLAGTEALKVLLGRGEVVAAPWSLQFDAYRGRLKRVRRRAGTRSLYQRIVLHFARRALLPP
jgi:molybdopterin/thiamine biosynthesis adenylyltransferase